MLSIDINQKLGLCHALLELGDWGGATNLMKLLPPLLPVWSLPVTKSICSLVHLSIEPIYRRLAITTCTFFSKFLSNKLNLYSFIHTAVHLVQPKGAPYLLAPQPLLCSSLAQNQKSFTQTSLTCFSVLVHKSTWTLLFLPRCLGWEGLS